MWCRFGIPKIILLGDAIANESLSAETRPAMVALSLSLSPSFCLCLLFLVRLLSSWEFWGCPGVGAVGFT